MKVGLGCDHCGYEFKTRLINDLKKEGFTIIDYGTYSSEPVDYPDYALKVCDAYNDGFIDFGIVLCATGIGVSIVCNKINNIRCALATTVEIARVSREHNDSNILAIGSKYMDYDIVLEIVLVFLNESFSNEERHINRLEKVRLLQENDDE